MFINFNIEKLNKLLYDFYSLTGLAISIWDAQFHQLSFQPIEMQSFCKMIKQRHEGNHRCLLSDKSLCIKAAETGLPTTHYCHAGLFDTAIPIKYKDTIMGFIIFGQVIDNTNTKVTENLKKLSYELKLDYGLMLEAYNKLDTYDQKKIASAANILKMATRYLWLSEYIEIGYSTLASQIDDYIRAHISEDISIRILCEVFGISKNKLYEVSHEWFKMSIGDYIISKRIAEAKRLLTSTNLPINQIGNMVGIKDYNYFTKFFKTQAGIPPLKYRKGYPLNIHNSAEWSDNQLSSSEESTSS